MNWQVSHTRHSFKVHLPRLKIPMATWQPNCRNLGFRDGTSFTPLLTLFQLCSEGIESRTIIETLQVLFLHPAIRRGKDEPRCEPFRNVRCRPVQVIWSTLVPNHDKRFPEWDGVFIGWGGVISKNRFKVSRDKMSIDTIALRVRTMDIPFNIIDPNA